MYICVIFMAHASAASYFPGKPPSPQEKKNLKKIHLALFRTLGGLD